MNAASAPRALKQRVTAPARRLDTVLPMSPTAHRPCRRAPHAGWPRAALAALAVAVAGWAPAAAALTFNFTFTSGTSAQAIAGFQAAGALWSSVLSDPVTVNLTVGTAPLGGTIVGQAYSRQIDVSYASVRAALIADATSPSDATAVAHLFAGSVPMLINRTADNPNGSGSATAYLDNNGSANNTTVHLTTANALALGLPVSAGDIPGQCTGCDAFIQFNSSFAFDYTRANGITGGTIDFVGVAAHEIGHALGFISGVDTLDQNSPPLTQAFAADSFTELSVLDLFRYSSASRALGAVDFTASTSAKYFSLDGGVSVGPGFATGMQFGDGRQASHWKDSLGLGLMDPTVDIGLQMNIAANDVLAMDAIGWNLAAVPEAGSALLFGVGLGAMLLWARRGASRAQPLRRRARPG